MGSRREYDRVLGGYFAHERRVMFENSVSDPMSTITAVLPGSKWSELLLSLFMQDLMSSVISVFPGLRPTQRLRIKRQVAEMFGKKERASLDKLSNSRLRSLKNERVFVAACCCGHAGIENGRMTCSNPGERISSKLVLGVRSGVQRERFVVNSETRACSG